MLLIMKQLHNAPHSASKDFFDYRSNFYDASLGQEALQDITL